MSIRLFLTVLFGTVVFAACGGSTGPDITPEPALSPTASPASTPIPPTPAPRTHLRIAYVNMHSPFPLDDAEEASVAAETMDERVAMVIALLKAMNPDIIAFSQVSWSEETGGAVATFAAELKMEFQYTRSAPWLPGQTQEESDELVQQLGWEQGLLVLSKDPILSADRFSLPGRDPETGLGEVALHVVVSAPVPGGILHVYVAELRDDDEIVQIDQAADLRAFIENTSPEGSVVLVGTLGPADTNAVWLLQRRLNDLALEYRGDQAYGTCCRDTVLDLGAPLRARSDYIMSKGWLAEEIIAFGHLPQARADGSALYISTHNGLMAVLPLGMEETAEPPPN